MSNVGLSLVFICVVNLASLLKAQYEARDWATRRDAVTVVLVCTVRYPLYILQEGPVIGPAHARAHLFFAASRADR
jgi:hypothetical protein